MKNNKNKRKASKQKSKKKKKNIPVVRFFRIVFSILFIYFIIVGVLFAYSYFSFNEGDEEGTLSTDKTSNLPEYTNVLLACTDEGEGRTDAIMIVSYNSISKAISLVSIPRDTRVDIPDYMWEVMVENFPEIAGDDKSYKKINAIPNYGKERGMEFLQEYIEDMLGIEIDYYAHFNLEGFRYIIDSVGGIEFDVPQAMRHTDPDIYLDPGLQLLDGDKAEQLLRYRTYPEGDLKRIEVQQQFMKAFFEKVVNLKTIISNLSAYVKTVTEYIDTNATIVDILKYVGELEYFDIDAVQNYTIPCTTATINGVSYVETDAEALLDFGYEIFKQPTATEDTEYEDSFLKSITILNGSYKKGFASQTQSLLEENGYTISEIGDYTGQKAEQTKIYVKELGQGTDLLKFFTNAKVVVNEQKVEEYGYDIVIVLGTAEELNEDLEDQTEEQKAEDTE